MSAVFSKQAEKVHRLKGKHVERDGKIFLITKVDWRRGKITASDLKTPIDQVTKFSIRSFLSKSVTVLDDAEAERDGAKIDRKPSSKDALKAIEQR